MDFSVTGRLVDYWERIVYPAEVVVSNGKITEVVRLQESELEANALFIMPGFIDAHIHIESSMLVPSEFARIAVLHGTVATISDPHEIANVCGIDGVNFMIENGKKVPFKFNFGAPSCVPATIFETAGAELNSTQVEELLLSPDILYLSEMMNFPGVLNKDPEVMKKIAAAQRLNKPVDGHAPGLIGEMAAQYIAAGISTDHECFTAVEALDKLKYGMKILIREGSAAKNFEALIDLLPLYPSEIMFCSDDKHPDSLVEGHIDQLCMRAHEKGIDLFDIIGAACINPVMHYKMNVGMLRVNDPADFIMVNNLSTFKTEKTFIDGVLVAHAGRSYIERVDTPILNQFECEEFVAADFSIPSETGTKFINVIEALDGQLITNKKKAEALIVDNRIVSDVENDHLKIVVVNRYHPAPIAKAFIRNFGMSKGALASSVAHDSHNIVAVGVDDESICRAINLVVRERGGVSCVFEEDAMVVGLPVAGLMSAEDGFEIARQYTAIDAMAKRSGTKLKAPFMTLSFMALLVIPHFKLSDKGLFDGDSFSFVPLLS